MGSTPCVLLSHTSQGMWGPTQDFHEPGQTKDGLDLSQPYLIDVDELGSDPHLLLHGIIKGQMLIKSEAFSALIATSSASCEVPRYLNI